MALEEDLMKYGEYSPQDKIDLLKDIPIDEYQQNRPAMPFQERPRELARQDTALKMAQAQRAFEQGQQERGVVDVGGADKFRQRGLMIGGVQVAQEDYKNAIDQENQVIGHLIQTSGIKDANQQAKMKQQLQDKFNKLRFTLAQQAHKFNLGLTNAKYDQAKKLQYYQMMGQIAQTAGYAAASGQNRDDRARQDALRERELNIMEGGQKPGTTLPTMDIQGAPSEQTYGQYTTPEEYKATS